MAVAGSLTYETKIDKNGFNKGLKDIESSTKNSGTKIKDIVTALGIDKIISTTMNTLKSSISSAMDRIDTMNQFTRVMTVMTGSAEKADEALESIKNTVTGTAYGLDVASKSTQKFVTSGMKLDKSTKQIQTWGDAVAFYGDGTNATFEGVTDALSKMVAKGKVEMDQLNRLTDAGIPAVQIYADSVGKSVTQVQEDLSKGKISTDKFLDGLDKAFNNGTKKFASITGSAKEAGASWTATFDNFKAAITRGMTNIINAIDDGLKSIGLKTMREMISEVGKQAEKTMNKITPLIKKGIKALKDMYDWIKRNMDLVKNLIIVIASLTASYIAYQKTLVAIKAIQTAKNIISTTTAFLSLIPSIRSAKDAMLLLNMTFSANPVGLVVTGVVALTTALVAFSLKQTDSQKEAKKFADEMANSKQKMLEYNESIDKTTNANLSHIQSAEKLRSELTQLVDENGKVKKGYEGRVDFILNQLNEALGTEYKRTGEVIDKYKDLQGEIDKLIIKKKAEIILQGEEEKYKTAIENQKEAVEELRKSQENLGMSYDEAKQKYQDYITSSDEAFKNMDTKKQLELSLQSKEMNALKDKIKAYQDAEDKVIEYNNNIKSYEDKHAKYMEEKYDEIAKTITVSTEDWTSKSLDEINKSIQEQSNAMEQYKEIYRNTGDEVARENAEQNRKNLEELAKHLRDMTSTTEEMTPQQIEAWKNLASNSYETYSEIVSDMDEPIQKKIQDTIGVIAAGTPQMQEKAEELGRKTVEEFDKSADAKTKALNTITGYLNGLDDNTKKELLRQAGIEDVDKVLDELNRGDLSEDNGKNILEGLWKGLKNNTWQGKILGVASGLAKAVNKSFTGKDGWDEHSPSKKMKKFAENYIQPISDVMNKRKRQITDTAKKLANSVNDSFDLEKINDDIISKMNRAVSLETGSINAKASIKSNNSMLNIIQASFNVDGSVNIDGQRAGRILTPYMTKTLRTGGAY